MTISTRCRRTGKLGQVRRRLQAWYRGRMTQRTGIIMDNYNYFATMTRCTLGACSDRSIVHAASRVRRMVVVTVRLAGLVCMTGCTGVAGTRCNYTLYRCGRRVVELTVRTVILMTGRAAVEVMQAVYLTPGTDRSMAATAAGAVGYLVGNAVVIGYVMTRGRRMRRMTVKVSCMTL